jgi:hypothetical protein
MAPQFDRALRELLRAAGCTLVRQGRGSHEIWLVPRMNPSVGGSISLGVAGHSTVGSGFGGGAAIVLIR